MDATCSNLLIKRHSSVAEGKLGKTDANARRAMFGLAWKFDFIAKHSTRSSQFLLLITAFYKLNSAMCSLLEPCALSFVAFHPAVSAIQVPITT
jgi:hypothetical protein